MNTILGRFNKTEEHQKLVRESIDSMLEEVEEYTGTAIDKEETKKKLLEYKELFSQNYDFLDILFEDIYEYRDYEYDVHCKIKNKPNAFELMKVAADATKKYLEACDVVVDESFRESYNVMYQNNMKNNDYGLFSLSCLITAMTTEEN